MRQLPFLMNSISGRFLKALIVSQFGVILGVFLTVRTEYVWFWAVFSFIPCLIICLTSNKQGYVLSSLVLLFISQHALFIFANPSWGYSLVHLHDSINDFHVASIISENAHFELGHVGYGAQSYSYYPLLHIFSVTLSEISGMSLMFITRYIVPILNSAFVALSLYLLNFAFFGLKGQTRNMATLLFAIGWFYTSFHSQFVREAFAFPLALLSLFVVVKVIKGSSHNYAVVSPILFASVILSHHITSYLLFLLLALMAISSNIFHKNNRLNRQLFLMGVMLFSYVAFITVTLFVQQATSIYETFLLLFTERESVSIMAPYAPWRVYLAMAYYVIIGLFALIGSIRLLYEKRRKRVLFTPKMMVVGFLVLSFLLLILIRTSVSASPLSWAYDMATRGTIWAFIGIAIVAAVGLKYCLGTYIQTKPKGIIIVVSLIVCILAAGKFAQYPLALSDPTVTPYISYPRFMSTLWLKGEAVAGSNLLVAPYLSDPRAFEISRNMAPYSYLKGYFLDETKGYRYENFHGYIPLIGGFFDQYSNSPDVQMIYASGDTQIGYKR